MAVDFVLTGTATYNVTGTVTKIEAIGPGANGQAGLTYGYGGGGGEYAAKNNPTNVSTGSHDVLIGAGGSANDTWFKDNSGTIICRANRGLSDGTGGTGGVGDVKYDGGAGGGTSGQGGGGGGGGAAGPNGAGKAGGTGGTEYNGGGGGGADNGEVGQAAQLNAGGYGGASGLPTSARGDGAVEASNATTGTLGAGGGGSWYVTRSAAPGSSGGTQFDSSHGCGGGGGGGSGYEWGGAVNGAAGGAYGGGGGGGGLDTGDSAQGQGGTGGNGLLIITYTPGAVLAVLLHSDVVDNGLNEIVNDATAVYLCSQQPTTYAEASSTYALASAAISFNAPEAGGSPPDGRMTISDAITGGTVTATGTATHWAVCDGSRLLATGELSAEEAMTDGWVFDLEPITVVLPFG